ncbi:MAG: hypothetical protein K0Q49_1593 [Haloplasmataceae bacterium]|jgi:hypothetical protein|nr:hypothetical protein [Haloplasmataceae bacterium]
MKKDNNLLKLTFSAMVIAIYIIIMFASQWFSFGAVQIRIATSLYALPAIFPFLVFPLGLANGLSNTFVGGLGPIDIIGGFIVGLLTSSVVFIIKKYKLNDWFIAFPIIFIPGLIVPIWLAPILSALPDAQKITYVALALSLLAGQFIPGVVGVLMVKELKRRKITFGSLKIHNKIVEADND